MSNFDSHELAWAAGFFDGEGTVHLSAHKGSPGGASVHTSVHQVDRRPLERFQAAVGVGKIYGPRPNPPNRPISMFQTTTFEAGQALIAMLWRFLSAPKREQARQVLITKRDLGPGNASRRRTVCRRGHDLTDAPLTAAGYRRCKPCNTIDQRERRARRRMQA